MNTCTALVFLLNGSCSHPYPCEQQHGQCYHIFYSQILHTRGCQNAYARTIRNNVACAILTPVALFQSLTVTFTCCKDVIDTRIKHNQSSAVALEHASIREKCANDKPDDSDGPPKLLHLVPMMMMIACSWFQQF